MRKGVIAIDGPAGAGKSSAAQELARQLGYAMLDTGAIYRALALQARERQIAWSDGPKLAELAHALPIRFESRDGANCVYLGDREVSREIRQPEISQGASEVSALAEVRAALLDVQRRLAGQGGVVAEGRDMGTVVFPRAELKFFLTASQDVRARRRYEELEKRGAPATLAQTRAELEGRDERDQNREAAPLRQAPDAILIDSTDLTLDEVVAKMVLSFKKRQAK